MVYYKKGYKKFYFIAEAVPPLHAKMISKEILDRKIDVSWHSSIRVDQNFSVETLKLMRKSGYVRGTIGMESSNDRLLALLNKGYGKKTIIRFFNNLRKVSINNQELIWPWRLNVIADIPTTSFKEAMGVYEFCKKHSDLFDNISVFLFELSSSSPMGKRPDKYNINILKRKKQTYRANSICFKDPKGMSVSEKKKVFNLYKKLNQDLTGDCSAEEWTRKFSKLSGTRQNKEIFSFEKVKNLCFYKLVFNQRGKKVNAGEEVLVRGFKNKEGYIVSTFMLGLYKGLSGKVVNYAEVCESLKKHLGDEYYDGVAVDFLSACIESPFYSSS